jgi:sec-independent protein translocase protein TatA
MEFSMVHIIILLVIVLLVFGAKRIPEIGSSLGQGIREFKKSLKEVGSDSSSSPSLPPASGNATNAPPAGGGEPKRLSQ